MCVTMYSRLIRWIEKEIRFFTIFSIFRRVYCISHWHSSHSHKWLHIIFMTLRRQVMTSQIYNCTLFSFSQYLSPSLRPLSLSLPRCERVSFKRKLCSIYGYGEGDKTFCPKAEVVHQTSVFDKHARSFRTDLNLWSGYFCTGMEIASLFIKLYFHNASTTDTIHFAMYISSM